MRRCQLSLHGDHAGCVEMGREAVRGIDRVGDRKAENGSKKQAHDPIRDELVFRPCCTQNLGKMVATGVNLEAPHQGH